jgi:hypothetical protein
MHLFRSPVTITGTPGLLSASYLARWSTMAAPNLRWSSLTWSKWVFINTMLRMSPCSSCFPAAAVDGRGWRSANVARRGQPALGKREPGLKGSRESQKVSVSRRVNAALFCDAWKMSQVRSCARGRVDDEGVCVLLRGKWDGEDWPVSLTAGRRSDCTRLLICRHPCPRPPAAPAQWTTSSRKRDGRGRASWHAKTTTTHPRKIATQELLKVMNLPGKYLLESYGHGTLSSSSNTEFPAILKRTDEIDMRCTESLRHANSPRAPRSLTRCKERRCYA